MILSLFRPMVFLCAVFCLGFTNLEAKEKILVKAKVSGENLKFNFLIGINRYNNLIESFHIDMMERGRTERIHNYTGTELPQNFVMYRRHNKDVIMLSVKEFNPYVGGRVRIRYLHNVISGKYKGFNLYLYKNDENQWILYNSKNEPVGNFLIFKKKVAFTEVGISSIRVY